MMPSVPWRSVMPKRFSPLGLLPAPVPISVTFENTGEDRGISELLSRLLSASIPLLPSARICCGPETDLFQNSPDPSQTNRRARPSRPGDEH